MTRRDSDRPPLAACELSPGPPVQVVSLQRRRRWWVGSALACTWGAVALLAWWGGHTSRAREDYNGAILSAREIAFEVSQQAKSNRRISEILERARVRLQRRVAYDQRLDEELTDTLVDVQGRRLALRLLRSDAGRSLAGGVLRDKLLQLTLGSNRLRDRVRQLLAFGSRNRRVLVPDSDARQRQLAMLVLGDRGILALHQGESAHGHCLKTSSAPCTYYAALAPTQQGARGAVLKIEDPLGLIARYRHFFQAEYRERVEDLLRRCRVLERLAEDVRARLRPLADREPLWTF